MAAAAVLAGGASRRMGRDKATLMVGGVELASLVLAAAARVADPVVLVAPDGHPARGLAAPAVADPRQGPLAAPAAPPRAPGAEHVLARAAPGARLAGRAGDRSLLGLLAGLRTLVVEEPEWRRVDPDGRSFVDLDDPADPAAWDPGPR